MNTVRLKPEIAEKMRSLARRQGVSVSEIHRKAIESYLALEPDVAPHEPSTDKPRKSRWDSVIGVVRGSKDDSINVSRHFTDYVAKKHSHDTT
jgi:hypothetical protein